MSVCVVMFLLMLWERVCESDFVFSSLIPVYRLVLLPLSSLIQ